ncbi:MAG: GerAB/ArcD/ProY family transporter [Clostridiaceae bacterium]|nr:GerAB/ArcD/ProY family transporter [Clostridiaceae bacterium]
MPQNAKLTREQIFFFCFLGIIGNIVYTHTWMDNDTNRSAWVVAFFGILLVFPFALWLLYLGKFNPNGTIFDTIEKGTSKCLTCIICFIFILLNISIGATQLNMFTEMLRVFVLQNTPPSVIIATMIIIAFIVVNSDITIIGRLVEFLSVIALFNYFSSFVFAFPKMINIKYIFPIFDTSLLGVIKGIAFTTGTTSELLLFLMVIVSNIPDPFKHRKWVTTGIFSAAVVFSVAILIIVAMMSPELAKRISFGGVNAARLIILGNSITGLEIFVIGTYQFIALGKIIISMYCCWISFKRIFGERKTRFQLAISALLIAISTILINSYNNSYFIAVFLGRFIILPFSVIVLILASISIKKMEKKKGCALK